MDHEKNSLRVPSHETPTFWNRSALAGFLMFAGIGGLITGFLGKSKMEEELEYGKVVEKPSFFAWESVKDAAIGTSIGGMLTMLAVEFAVPLTAAITATTITTAFGGPIAAIAVLTVPSLIGLAWGAIHGKGRMEEEWAQAQAYVAEHGEYQGRGHALAQEQSRTPEMDIPRVTPEEAALLEARMHRGQHRRSFVEQLSQSATPDVALAR